MSALRRPEVPITLAPAAAGVRYPLDPRAALNSAFAAARADWRAPFKAILAPTGETAAAWPALASAVRSLSHVASLKRVVLLTPGPGAGLAIPPVESVETPFGPLTIDAEAAGRALSVAEARLDLAPFAAAPAVEIASLFLARSAGQVRLLPVLVGAGCPAAAVSELLAILWGGPETLLVFARSFNAIQPAATALDGLSAPEDDPALAGLLDLARRRTLRSVRLDLREGLACGFLSADEARTPKPLRDMILRAAREAIAAAVAGKPAPALRLKTLPPPLTGHAATFVTVSLEGRPRGSFSTPVPVRALILDAAANAVAAATGDPALPPLTPEEAGRLAISVSVLSPLRELPARSLEAAALRLTPGRDGLALEAAGRRGLFLPAQWARYAEPKLFVTALLRQAGFAEWPPQAKAWRFTVETIATP